MTEVVLTLQPLGGVGEIGSNMIFFPTPKQNIIVDIGILFPENNFFDLHYLVPDFALLDPAKPTTLIITHGHEDHIGAIVHLVDHIPDIKIHAPIFASELIRKKFKERNRLVEIEVYGPQSNLKFETFTVYPVLTNHSIPQTYGLLFKGQDYALFYISDFKIDPKSPYEPLMDFKRLKTLSKDCATRVLLADSTNILYTEKTPSEADLIPDLDKLFKAATGRIFITCFASNVHRVQTLFNLCHKYKKRIALLGKAMVNYTRIAHELQILTYPENLEILSDGPESPMQNDLVILMSGCQGEFLSAFGRISRGEDRNYKIGPNDSFIYSAKIIPGNERAVYKIFDNLIQFTEKLYTAKDFKIHASGHASQVDLRELIEAYDPTDHVPIHGTTYFLHKHTSFVRENFPHVRSQVMANHDLLTLEKSGSGKLELKITQGEHFDPVMYHGKSIPIEREAIRDRRKIAQNGLILISIPRRLSHHLEIQITPVGLPFLMQAQVAPLQEFIFEFIHRELKKKMTDKGVDLMGIAIRRHCNELLGYKPRLTIHIV